MEEKDLNRKDETLYDIFSEINEIVADINQAIEELLEKLK